MPQPVGRRAAIAFCVARNNKPGLLKIRHEEPEMADPGEKAEVRFGGGNGDTIDRAVVIRGAAFDLAATWAEFAYVTQAYGQKDKDWKLISHTHGKQGDREIDTIEIELPGGERRNFFFDVTESFGKWPSAGESYPKVKDGGDSEDTLFGNTI